MIRIVDWFVTVSVAAFKERHTVRIPEQAQATVIPTTLKFVESPTYSILIKSPGTASINTSKKNMSFQFLLLKLVPLAVLALVLLAALGLAVTLVVVFVSVAVPVMIVAVVMVVVVIMTVSGVGVPRMRIASSLAVGAAALGGLLTLRDEVLHGGIEGVYLSCELIAHALVVCVDDLVRSHGVLFAELPAGSDLVHRFQLLGGCTLDRHCAESDN